MFFQVIISCDKLPRYACKRSNRPLADQTNRPSNRKLGSALLADSIDLSDISTS